MDAALRDLTVPDGSCRDINLFGVARSGAERLLAWVCSQFESHVGSAYPTGEDVKPIEQADFATPLAAGHMVCGYLEGGSVLFDHLQYLVVRGLGWNEGGDPPGPKTTELLSVLAQVSRLLREAGERHWATWVNTAAARIRAGDASGLDLVLDANGGMGSFNDLVPVRGQQPRGPSGPDGEDQLGTR